MSKVGFIGVGYMGYGMVKNLLKKHDVYIFAHKNRKPINKLLKIGAHEIKSYDELKNSNLDCLMLCVTNTPIALKVANKIKKYLQKKIYQDYQDIHYNQKIVQLINKHI